MRLCGFIKRLLPGTSSERSRLEGDIAAFEKDLEDLKFKKKIIKENIEHGSWADLAGKSLDETIEAMKDCDFDRAWRCLHKAQNMSLQGLENEGRKIKA